MNLLKYKGKHIRVSDKSLVFRFSAGSLFLAVIMLLENGWYESESTQDSSFYTWKRNWKQACTVSWFPKS